MKRPKPVKVNDSIAIRVTIDGRRHELRGFGRHDDAQALQNAQKVADTLWADMLSDRVLPNLSHYTPKGKLALLEIARNPKAPPKLTTVWSMWIAYKSPGLSDNTLQGYAASASIIRKAGLDSCRWNVISIRTDLLLGKLDGARRAAKHLAAMSLWAFENDIIPSNLLGRLMNDFPTAGTIPIPKPLSAEQRHSILTYLLRHDTYRYYYPITLFMFHTGCRPCEAVGALQSSLNMERKQVTLGRSVVHLSGGSTQERELSKTGRLRIFPLSTALLELFGSYQINNPETPLFPSLSGKYINFDNYRRRVWRSALENIGLK